MTQVVQLSDEAYRRLSNAKRPEESYSDAVLRLVGGKDLRDLEGLREPDEIDKFLGNLRKADRLDIPGA